MKQDNLPELLPWGKICKEVKRVAKEIAKSRYINVYDIIDHIQEDEASFPAMTGRTWRRPHKPVTTKAMAYRISEAAKLMGWQPWNRTRARTTGRIFILPWMKEDPAVGRGKRLKWEPIIRMEAFDGIPEEGRAVTG